MSEWVETTIGEIADIIGGGTPKTSVPEYWNGEIPWLSVVDFNNNQRYVYETLKKITERGLKESTTRLLKKGQIIVSARGTVGAIAQLGKDMTFNQSCYGLNAKSVTSNNYLYYLLKQSVNELKHQATGGVFDTIIRDTFYNIQVALPPLPEQEAIAEVLSSLDDKIDLLTRQNKTLEALAQTYFRQWFIEEANDDWEVVPIEKKYNVLLGGTPSRKIVEYWTNGTIGWINSGKINEFRITEASEYITEAALKNSSTKILPSGTTVIAITGATLGQISMIESSFSANQSVIGLVPKAELSNAFIYLWIKENMDLLISKQTGGAQQHINSNDVKFFGLIVPPKEKLKKFKNIIEPLFNKISSNCFQIQTLQKLRDTLLPKLISGEVKVKH